MNNDTILKRLLALALLASGCELIDLDDLDDDDDDDMSESGDEGDDDEDESDGDDGGAEDDEGEDDAADEDESGEDDGTDPSADETGDGGAADTDDGGVEDTGVEDTGALCEEGTAACEDAASITVCVEGELFTVDCGELCIEAGFLGALGCAFDEESGSDVCFCDDGSGGEGGSEGGA